MGNWLSRNRLDAETRQSLQELHIRLSSLEKLDLNEDGVVSQAEFELWRKEQTMNLEIFRQQVVQEEKSKHLKRVIEKDQQISELKKELKGLLKMNNRLERSILDLNEEILISGPSTENQVKNTGGIASEATQKLSEKQIKKFVDELLQDDSVNIEYLPDWVERQLYLNFFQLLIGLLKKSVGSTAIELMGHRVILELVPSKLPEARTGGKK